MNSTVKYYDENAEVFINSSVDADMSEIYKVFLSQIPDNGYILDAGCGSGRDSKYFIEHGYKVDAFDASYAMCNYASKYIGQNVCHATFDEYTSGTKYNGIWASATLLHVEKDKLIGVINKLLNMLVVDGVMYCSWKYGENERLQQDGKYYFDVNEVWIDKNISNIQGNILRIWKSLDVRPGNTTYWINVLLKHD